MKDTQVSLLPEEMPRYWYNILPDLEKYLEPLPPPIGDEQLKRLPEVMIHEPLNQEFSKESWIEIPEELLEVYFHIGRPRQLFRATGLEKFLKTPSEMYYKAEFNSPTGSHKVNTAIAQAYYAKKQGIKHLVTETGAGQWGTALSLAASLFRLKCRVYWVRKVHDEKIDRRNLMKMFGAEVFASPSSNTDYGRKFLEKYPNHHGSLAIAISEGMKDALNNKDMAYALGSVLNHVLLHQTIIGLEAKKQFEKIGKYPTIIISCLGGGSNFGGLAIPFVADVLKEKKKIKFIAAQTQATPNLQGKYRYDYADHAEMTPMLKMYTLGHDIDPPPIYGDGLRYHACAPIISLLRKHGLIDTVAYPTNEKRVFDMGQLFLKTEGYLPAPESDYSICAAVEEALRSRKTGKKEIILFNVSDHGFMDMVGYDKVLELSK